MSAAAEHPPRAAVEPTERSPHRGPQLLLGRGMNLGPYSTRFPTEHRTLLHLLRAQAVERGDDTWLVFDGRERMTYAEAQVAVNGVAHALIESVGAGGHVALLLRNQIEFMPAFLGAMAAGGAAVPLNAESRGPLLEFVIAKSDASTMVARVDLLDRLVELDSLGDVRLVVACGDGDVPERIHGAPVMHWEDWLAGRPASGARELPAGWDTALIQFTSGTTGQSKGVVYPHQFLYFYSSLECDSLGHSAEDVLTTPLPLCHAGALNIIACSALQVGAVAHLKSHFSARSYWTQVAEDGATFGIIFGPMAAILMKTVPKAPEHRMRRMFCVPFPPGGEEFERRYDVKLLWQGYGMTEIMPHPMASHVEEGVPFDTMGHPVSWMEYGAVDEHDRLLPAGEVGQLVYRSLLPDAMAREYYKAPEATVEAFRNSMFHTGDLGFIDEEGRVHYRGRKQDRIRRRGENISAAELEFVALSHPDILEAAAYGVPAELGENEVKLDVIVRGCGASLEELHAWLVTKLPRFMVPRYLEQHDVFPKTPSERVEKFKLAAEGLQERPGLRSFEPPPR
jgi:crotonobetaine/carnitine-CoA ligase